ncbi:hypothetical protein TWF481_011269 [Arthrobotrys musiformis]|uniref:Uncharacterized protein n=1 Tax=Arthrobotrys musiformis TaxID=47236 RepID=A0AAV9VZ95_9PEZI
MILTVPGRASLPIPLMRDPSARNPETEADLPVESGDAPLLVTQLPENGKEPLIHTSLETLHEMIVTEAGIVEIVVEIADVQLLHVADQLLPGVRAERDQIPLARLTYAANRLRGSEALPLAEPPRDPDVKDVQGHQDAILLIFEDRVIDTDRKDPDPDQDIVHREISVAHAKTRRKEEANGTSAT